MARQSPNIAGQRFGLLTAIECVSGEGRRRKWRCQCDCGNERVTAQKSLRDGDCKSCGCLHKAAAAAHCRSMATHGMRNSPEYMTWTRMKVRCLNPGHDSYPRYGGRGVKVCERWLNSFECFFEDMGLRPSPNHSLDRIDRDGNYEPPNCRWATKVEQQNNRSGNRIVSYRGSDMTLADAIRAAGNVVNKDTARERLNRGWSVERTVETAAGPLMPGRSVMSAA